MIERIVIASPGGWEAASTRYRLEPMLKAGTWPADAVSAASFPTDEKVDRLLEIAGKRSALVLQRVMPNTRQLDRLRRAFDYLIFDIDDAIYTIPPDLESSWLRKAPKHVARLAIRGSPFASARKRPLERTLAQVDVCVVGNSILGDFAQQHAGRVVEIPTTIDPIPAPPKNRPEPPVVVWQGLAGSLVHLAILRKTLESLAQELQFTFRVVSSSSWTNAPFPVEFIPWSVEANRRGLETATVGLAPLVDHPWTRGKCALRSIQYGGHALPTVASPVGITDRVIRDGETGFLARTSDEWADAIRRLLLDESLASEMGAAALRHVQAHYSDSLAIRSWHALIASLDSKANQP